MKNPSDTRVSIITYLLMLNVLYFIMNEREQFYINEYMKYFICLIKERKRKRKYTERLKTFIYLLLYRF